VAGNRPPDHTKLYREDFIPMKVLFITITPNTRSTGMARMMHFLRDDSPEIKLASGPFIRGRRACVFFFLKALENNCASRIFFSSRSCAYNRKEKY